VLFGLLREEPFGEDIRIDEWHAARFKLSSEERAFPGAVAAGKQPQLLVSAQVALSP
jgi:hypothetical protein